MVEDNSIKKKNSGFRIKEISDSIFKLVIAGLLIYFTIYYFNFGSPIKVDNSVYKKIDSVNNVIKNLEKQQILINSEIKDLRTNIDTIDVRISGIKKEKIIIKEKYNEKIRAIDTYSNAELDSVLSKRYPGSY